MFEDATKYWKIDASDASSTPPANAPKMPTLEEFQKLAGQFEGMAKYVPAKLIGDKSVIDTLFPKAEKQDNLVGYLWGIPIETRPYLQGTGVLIAFNLEGMPIQIIKFEADKTKFHILDLSKSPAMAEIFTPLLQNIWFMK